MKTRRKWSKSFQLTILLICSTVQGKNSKHL
jgi:hypothetical protein